jgi:hypothetical protein
VERYRFAHVCKKVEEANEPYSVGARRPKGAYLDARRLGSVEIRHRGAHSSSSLLLATVAGRSPVTQPDNEIEKNSTEEGQERTDVTREELYALVWAEPMLRVAATFDVSSSYMARICKLMNVPRPERGYWAKLAVGKQSPRPELLEPRPGDQIIWNRSGESHPVRRALPRPPVIRPRRKPAVVKAQSEVHLLIHGAKMHFEAGRTSYDSEYLKPAKRSLVDLVVSKAALDKALGFANELFRELEARSCRVVLAPSGEQMRRAGVDEHEVPRKKKDNYYDYHRLWSPGRNTVVYIGTVAIGLTVMELSEEAEARYVKGKYLRVDPQAPVKRNMYAAESDWTTKRDFPTGRLCLQAYCPDWRGEWTKQWKETRDRDLTSRIPSIVGELLDAAPVIAGLIEVGERKAELERQTWEEERRERERKEAQERAAKAQQDSREELLQIVDAWAQVRRIEEFFIDAESRLHGFEPERRAQLHRRLNQARALLGTTDTLERFRRWKSPAERA